MFSPEIDIILYLSAAFLLGASLGWALWKRGADEMAASVATETEFWRRRLTAAQDESAHAQEEIERLKSKAAARDA